jgi:hypothetical protein
MRLSCATVSPWHEKTLQHPSYGSEETYRLAAHWMRPCSEVADWGGSAGYLRRFLDPGTRYHVVDGTAQCEGTTVADLANYREPADGIVLRHVLDNTPEWERVLANALAAFRTRLAIVTFTPDAPVTTIGKMKSGWPVWHFNPADLIALMGSALVAFEEVRVTHPERVFYLERRPCAS